MPSPEMPIGQNKGDRQRAWRLRQKQAKGTIKDHEMVWLAQYESVIEPKDRTVEPDDTGTPDPDEPVAVPEVKQEPPPVMPPPDMKPDAPPPKAPPLPRIPRIDLDDDAPHGKASSSDRWQSKYGNTGTAADAGREETCKAIAAPWLQVLKLLTQEMIDAGISPVINPDLLYGSMVITVDSLLPKEVKLSPQMVAAGGSTAIIVQRFVKRKAIKEYQDKKKEKSDHESRIEELRKRQDLEREQAEAARAKRSAEAVKAKPVDAIIVEDQTATPASESVALATIDFSNPDTVF